jgi:hypothetical protein
MMKKILVIIAILAVHIMMPSGVMAESDGFGNGVVSLVKKVGSFIDTMAIKGLDTRYIEAPQRPWQIILRGNINQSDLKLSATTAHAEDILFFMKDEMTWEPRIKTDPATYAGFWAGYRGYGFGYSWNVGGDKGRILTFGATGGCYGVNLRIHWFDNDEPEVYMKGTGLEDVTEDGKAIFAPIEYNGKVEIGSPIKTRALFLDGYYLFNKRCSYAAAYDQSVFQKRSSGSLMAGAMYFHSSTEYDNDLNADLIMLMSDIGVFKTDQISAGVGYIYNWVPVKGLLISAMAIPMVTFYNHHKMRYFNSTLKEVMQKEGWEDAMDMDDANYKIWLTEEETHNSNIRLNVDARLSITYEWSERLFFNAFGQFSNFNYKTDYMKGRLNEWYINASLGLRL